jgi:hypothetical protein
MIRKILLAIGVLFIIIQVIRPNKNISATENPNAIDQHYAVPQEIVGILKKSCYDCHSNNTVYPWYSEIQPVAWWLQDHVNEGKQELNFDEFNNYDLKKKRHKMDEVAEVITENEMPLGSYTLIHREAILSPQEKESIVAWANALKKSIN